MKLAATLMWGTHINLTPVYFNKAEGCYKYDPACRRVVIAQQLHSVLFKKKKFHFITNEQEKLSSYLHT